MDIELISFIMGFLGGSFFCAAFFLIMKDTFLRKDDDDIAQIKMRLCALETIFNRNYD